MGWIVALVLTGLYFVTSPESRWRERFGILMFLAWGITFLGTIHGVHFPPDVPN